MELLAPAGNLLNAYSALKAGADAIYVGGKKFSARASADNFSLEELKEITFYAHAISKKVYVTLNTLLYQDEFFEAVDFAKYLDSINIDGLIVQDLGLAHYLHQTLPSLPLHASTQLNCHNIKQAEALIKIGFKRIVLAREANLETIKKIKSLGVEVEVFGHGALCVCYSGNCLLSSFIGDRSGNRGKCAQPCRLRYDLLEDGETIEKSAFEISTKDLMTLDYLSDFNAAKVDSLKIEGRLKSNEYIYSVTSAYRHAIDALVKKQNNNSIKKDKDELTKIFNRQFTKGFVLGESPFNLLNKETSSHQGEQIGKVVRTTNNRVSIYLTKDVHRLDGIRFESSEQFGLTIEKMFLNSTPVETATKGNTIEIAGIDNANRLMNLSVIKTKDIILYNRIQENLKEQIKVPLKVKFVAKVNEPISIELQYKDWNVKLTGDIAQKAEKNGTDKKRILEQLSKTGTYPYSIKDANMRLEKCFIPISSLNSLRNKAIEELISTINLPRNLEFKDYQNICNSIQNTSKTSIIIESITQLHALSSQPYDLYYFNNDSFSLENRVTKREAFDKEHEFLSFPIIKEADNELIASHYCNITNSYSLDCYYALGFNQCVLSPELDYSSIKMLINDFENRNGFQPNLGVVLYGKLDVMIMKSCPIGAHFKNKDLHCNRCHRRNYQLKDRIGECYKLIGDSECNTRLLNNKPLYIIDKIDELKNIGISNFWFIFTDENKEKVSKIITHDYQNKESFNNSYTRCHYNKRAL